MRMVDQWSPLWPGHMEHLNRMLGRDQSSINGHYPTTQEGNQLDTLAVWMPGRNVAATMEMMTRMRMTLLIEHQTSGGAYSSAFVGQEREVETEKDHLGKLKEAVSNMEGDAQRGTDP